jgi:hypothetical protein
MSNSKKDPKWRNYLDIGLAFITVVSVVFNRIDHADLVSSQEKLRNSEYLIQSIQYAPRLKLTNLPVISPVHIQMKSQNIPREALKDNSPTNPLIIETSITEIRVYCQLKFTNLQTSKATIISYAYADTTDYQARIRETMLAGDTSSAKVAYIKEPVELLQGDSQSFKVEHVINFMAQNQFILHFMVLYRNELGQMFDTYVWVAYEYHPTMLEGRSNEILSIEREPVSTYFSYSKSEREQMEKFLDKVKISYTR